MLKRQPNRPECRRYSLVDSLTHLFCNCLSFVWDTGLCLNIEYVFVSLQPVRCLCVD